MIENMQKQPCEQIKCKKTEESSTLLASRTESVDLASASDIGHLESAQNVEPSQQSVDTHLPDANLQSADSQGQNPVSAQIESPETASEKFKRKRKQGPEEHPTLKKLLSQDQTEESQANSTRVKSISGTGPSNSLKTNVQGWGRRDIYSRSKNEQDIWVNHMATHGNLDAKQISQEVQMLLKTHNINQHTLGRKLLDVAAKTISDLLKDTREWKKLSKIRRERYARIYIWQSDPNNVQEMMTWKKDRLSHILISVEDSVALTIMAKTELNHAKIARDVKELLRNHGVAFEKFGWAVLNVSGATICGLLSELQTWEDTLPKHREYFHVMKMWYDSPIDYAEMGNWKGEANPEYGIWFANLMSWNRSQANPSTCTRDRTLPIDQQQTGHFFGAGPSCFGEDDQLSSSLPVQQHTREDSRQSSGTGDISSKFNARSTSPSESDTDEYYEPSDRNRFETMQLGHPAAMPRALPTFEEAFGGLRKTQSSCASMQPYSRILPTSAVRFPWQTYSRGDRLDSFPLDSFPPGAPSVDPSVADVRRPAIEQSRNSNNNNNAITDAESIPPVPERVVEDEARSKSPLSEAKFNDEYDDSVFDLERLGIRETEGSDDSSD